MVPQRGQKEQKCYCHADWVTCGGLLRREPKVAANGEPAVTQSGAERKSQMAEMILPCGLWGVLFVRGFLADTFDCMLYLSDEEIYL